MAINADQTDAGSAVDQTLMDELRRRSAEFDIGDYKEHNSYNGILPVGAGWMLCDGRIINEASYNSEHGAGKWALDIGTTVLEGLYLPDFDNKFSVGGDTTTQTGASPITSEGNADHEINLRHNHQWMKGDINFSGNRDRNRTWDSAGNEINLVKYTTDETQAGSPHGRPFLAPRPALCRRGNIAGQSPVGLPADRAGDEA